jgi:hypothetical protein
MDGDTPQFTSRPCPQIIALCLNKFCGVRPTSSCSTGLEQPRCARALSPLGWRVVSLCAKGIEVPGRLKTHVGAAVSHTVAFSCRTSLCPTQPTIDHRLVRLRIHGKQVPHHSWLRVEIGGSTGVRTNRFLNQHRLLPVP